MPGSAEHQASAAIDKFTPPQVDSTISSAIPPDKMEPRPEDTVKPVNLQQEVIPTRTTTVSAPRPAANPLQFVKVGPAGLYRSAQEQLKKVEEVKKIKPAVKDDAEDWQFNLDNWKCSRRKRQEHIIERVVEVKKFELEEHDRNRKRSKTFSEMMEERSSRGRKMSLPVYQADNSDDLSDLGLSSGPKNKNVNSTNSENESSENENSSCAVEGVDSGTGEPEYTYERAIQSYVNFAETRVKSRSNQSLTETESKSADLSSKKFVLSNSESKCRGSARKIEKFSELQQKRSSSSNDLSSSAGEVKKAVSVPKVNISKRRELFEKMSDNDSSEKPSRVSNGDLSTTKTIRERLSSLEKLNEDSKMNSSKTVVESEVSVKERLSQMEKISSSAEKSSVKTIPVKSCLVQTTKEGASFEPKSEKIVKINRHSIITKEIKEVEEEKDYVEASSPTDCSDDIFEPNSVISQSKVTRQSHLRHRSLDSLDVDLSNGLNNETFERVQSLEDLDFCGGNYPASSMSGDTDREDSGIHTADVSSSVSQADDYDLHLDQDQPTNHQPTIIEEMMKQPPEPYYLENPQVNQKVVDGIVNNEKIVKFSCVNNQIDSVSESSIANQTGFCDKSVFSKPVNTQSDGVNVTVLNQSQDSNNLRKELDTEVSKVGSPLVTDLPNDLLSDFSNLVVSKPVSSSPEVNEVNLSPESKEGESFKNMQFLVDKKLDLSCQKENAINTEMDSQSLDAEVVETAAESALQVTHYQDLNMNNESDSSLPVEAFSHPAESNTNKAIKESVIDLMSNVVPNSVFPLELSSSLEPPKEKPPPPPTEASDEEEVLPSKSSLRRLDSTKRIKKEIRQKRSSFLGIENASDESFLEPELEHVKPPPDMNIFLQKERRLEQMMYRQSICSESDSTQGESRDSGVELDRIHNDDIGWHQRHDSEPFTGNNSTTSEEEEMLKKESDSSGSLEQNVEKLYKSSIQNDEEFIGEKLALRLRALEQENSQLEWERDDEKTQRQIDELARCVEEHRQQELKQKQKNINGNEALKREVINEQKETWTHMRRSLQDVSIDNYQPKQSIEDVGQMETELRRSLQDVSQESLVYPEYNSSKLSRLDCQSSMPNLQENMVLMQSRRPPPPVPPFKKPPQSSREKQERMSAPQQMSKQTLQALSAVPRSRLISSETWMQVKRKPKQEAYNYQHWLIQEAEHRRITEQNQRQAHMPIRRSVNNSNYVNTPVGNAPPQPINNDQWIESCWQRNTVDNQWNPQHESQWNNNIPTSNGNNWAGSSSSLNSMNTSNWTNSLPSKSKKWNGNANDGITAQGNQWNCGQTQWNPSVQKQEKPLPDSIIQTLTQRVQNKISLSDSNNNANRRSQTRHEAAIVDNRILPNISNENHQEKILSVSGKKKCSYCGEELGRGAAMIIESLRLFYHIDCFKCCVCCVQLGDGMMGTDVRVRNNKLHCHNCYSSDDGVKFSCV